MKRKILAVMLMGAMALSMLSGCSKDNEIKDAEQVSGNNTMYGEVSAISDDSITIKVGNMNMGMRGGERPAGDETRAENENMSEGETMPEIESMPEGITPKAGGFDASSMIELTGEEKEIKITDDTVVKKKMGGFGRGNMGNPSEMPTGEEVSRPEMPSGEEGGAMPEMPSGEDGSMPEGGRGPGGFGQMAEEIDLKDVIEGDIVAITLDDDGNAKEIIVMTMNEMMEQPSGGQESTNNEA